MSIKDNESRVNFGFKKVLKKQKIKMVSEVFSDVASKYDIMNDLMSLGLHRFWKNTFVDRIVSNTPGSANILEVGGGTGDITFRLCRKNPNLQIVVSDINPQMLALGYQKSFNKGFFQKSSWVLADAENLPFLSDTFDSYVTAFCLRNVSDLHKALQEAYRVLKPGGRFFCLEFSKVTNQQLAKAYKFWSFSVIPRLGELVANNRNAYQYLAESIEKFLSAEEFVDLLLEVGFGRVGYQSMKFGVVCIHTGVKA